MFRSPTIYSILISIYDIKIIGDIASLVDAGNLKFYYIFYYDSAAAL